MNAPEPDEQLADRWQGWLRASGPACVRRPVLSHGGDGESADGPPQLLVRELFVRAEPDLRRALDLLLVGLVERGRMSGPAASRELVVVGSEVLRGLATARADGFTVAELSLGPVGPGIRAVSLALVRVDRRTRSRDVLSSIEELGRLLDHAADPAGSAAVERSVVGRLDVLAGSPGVTVSVAGTVNRPWLDAGPDTMYLLADAGAPVELDEIVELRNGRVSVTRGSRAGPWRGDDYVLLRTGRPAKRRGQVRTWAQLRSEHAIAEGSLGAETRLQADTYSSRAATARQSLRAAQILTHARAGQLAEATDLLQVALTQPGAEGPLVDQVAGLVAGVPDFWAVLPAVEQARDDRRATPNTRAIAGQLDQRLGERLDAMLALAPGPDDVFDPIMTPVVLEVSDALVPIVDNQRDGGHFLFGLIPEVRDRIRYSTGVPVPGVRARGSTDFAAGRFGVQLDECWVATGSMLLDGEYAVHELGTEPGEPGMDFSEIHPLTGERGRFRIDPVTEGADPPGARLSRPQYLAHRIELAARAGLHLLLGRQELETLLEQWRGEDADLVTRALPDPRAALRLMLVLQDLVAERVPITDWVAILGAITDAGGTGTPLRRLRRAIRLRLRTTLPGPRSGPLLVPVPEHLQELLGVDAEKGLDVPIESPIPFAGWLRETLGTTGPGIALLTHDAAVRERVATFVRAERDLVLTLSDDELEAG